jgi:hypothetical protein
MLGTGLHSAIINERTPSNFLAPPMRFERFFADFTALLDRFVAM